MICVGAGRKPPKTDFLASQLKVPEDQHHTEDFWLSEGHLYLQVWKYRNITNGCNIMKIGGIVIIPYFRDRSEQKM